jgi:hypothetical protein
MDRISRIKEKQRVKVKAAVTIGAVSFLPFIFCLYPDNLCPSLLISFLRYLSCSDFS